MRNEGHGSADVERPVQRQRDSSRDPFVLPVVFDPIRRWWTRPSEHDWRHQGVRSRLEPFLLERLVCDVNLPIQFARRREAENNEVLGVLLEDGSRLRGRSLGFFDLILILRNARRGVGGREARD